MYFYVYKILAINIQNTRTVTLGPAEEKSRQESKQVSKKSC